MQLIVFMIHVVKISFNHLRYYTLPQSVGTSLKIHFYAIYAFYTYYVLPLLVFSKFLKPNRHTKLKMDSDIHDSSAQLITNKLDSTASLLQLKLRNAGAICGLPNIVNILIIRQAKAHSGL